MMKEDISAFADGQEIEESEIATAVHILDDAVVFQDDAGSIFFLAVDPAAFEIGMVAEKAGLTPVEDADDRLKEKIYAALGKEEK